MAIQRILFICFSLLLSALFVCWLLYYTAIQLRKIGRREKPKVSDTAIILGAYTDGYNPSPPLVARLHAGLHLYRHGIVHTFVVSGGQGADETVSESRSMKRFLILNGVPHGCIFEDRRSTDTWENLNNSQQVMQKYGLGTAVIVTSDYHLPRALAVAKQLGMDVSGYCARSSRRELRPAMREVIARIKYTMNGQASI